uniref:Reverse transcriptase domain-containing protein n=1 Tax=Triticum urartu TaxID=4572 RepID=A0A8R7V8R9_TRIUA
MILKPAATDESVLHHPVYPDLPPTVLQYADDTLIIAHASTAAAQVLKKILDDFASAAGLCINFSKTTLVPMNVDPAVSDLIVQSLGCVTASFPQTYLGLPLSLHKLPPSAFQLIISSC